MGELRIVSCCELQRIAIDLNVTTAVRAGTVKRLSSAALGLEPLGHLADDLNSISGPLF
jgi:hypothetical protein